MAQGDWRPLARGRQSRRAREFLIEICDALRATSDAFQASKVPADAPARALLFAYAADVLDDPSCDHEASAWLERAVKQGSKKENAPGLFGGLCGTAWTVEHLAGAEDAELDPLVHVDERLESLLEVPRWDAAYDLIAGLVGIGVYGLERSRWPSGRRLVALVVTQLERLAASDDSGFRWHTAPEWLPTWQRETAPNGYDNLGMAHGIPGVVGFLARCVIHGVDSERAARLLDGAVSWLLAQKRVDDGRGWFGSWLAGNEDDDAPARAAWCYGDPGIAAALVAAARARDNDAWYATAGDLALAVAARAAEACGVRDAGLCHGAFGLAHVLARLHQATGLDAVRESAAAWLERGLDMHQTGTGIAGYRAHDARADENGSSDPYVADTSLLTGVAGIGLALAASLRETSPDWDRLLLLDLP